MTAPMLDYQVQNLIRSALAPLKARVEALEAQEVGSQAWKRSKPWQRHIILEELAVVEDQLADAQQVIELLAALVYDLKDYPELKNIRDAFCAVLERNDQPKTYNYQINPDGPPPCGCTPAIPCWNHRS
jgi:hypothetical protein